MYFFRRPRHKPKTLKGSDFLHIYLWNANEKCEVAVDLGDASLNSIQKCEIRIEITYLVVKRC
jgi:hypothetical protein